MESEHGATPSFDPRVCHQKNGHWSCMAALVKTGAPPDFKWTGGTALTAAIEHGHDGVVLWLLAAGGGNIDDQGTRVKPKRKDNPLCIAVSRNNERMVRYPPGRGGGLRQEQDGHSAYYSRGKRGALRIAEAAACGRGGHERRRRRGKIRPAHGLRRKARGCRRGPAAAQRQPRLALRRGASAARCGRHVGAQRARELDVARG